MANTSYSFNKRLKQLTTFDSIRRLKLLELFQYNFFGFILVLISAYILNNLVFNKTFDYLKKNNIKENKTKKNFLILCTISMIETFLIIVVLFYLRKILLLVPPVGHRLNKDFKTLTTFENVIGITLSFLLIQLLRGYRRKLSLILNYEEYLEEEDIYIKNHQNSLQMHHFFQF